MQLYLIEQDVLGLPGPYLTEALIVAKSERAAVKAAVSLGDGVSGFDLLVHRDRLTVYPLGEAPARLPSPRHTHQDSRVLIVGEGGGEDAQDYEDLRRNDALGLND